jgi:chromosome segregation ATPase
MANEDEVVYRTDRIANALVKARGTLEAVAYATTEPSFDRMLARRLEDLETLSTGADRVRAAEEAARSVENDKNSTDDQRYDADLEVRKAFWGAQQAAGVVMERIRESTSEVAGLGDILKESSDALDTGIEHLDKLEGLPGRTNSETMQLRVRLNNLRNAVTMAQGSLDRAMTRLESARTTAMRFEVSVSENNGNEPRSVAVDRTRSQLETDLSVAREGLKGLSGQVTIAGPAAYEATSQSLDLAKKAWAAAQNPTPQSDQQVSGGSGAQDYRPAAGGPSRDTNLDR